MFGDEPEELTPAEAWALWEDVRDLPPRERVDAVEERLYGVRITPGTWVVLTMVAFANVVDERGIDR